MVKKILIILLIILSFTVTASEATPFKLSLKTDSLIISTGLILNVSSLLLDIEQKEKQNRDEINIMDQYLMNPYSNNLNKLSELVTYSSLLTPLIFISTPNKNWIPIGVMYTEALLLTFGLKEIGKNLITRYRPYMYYDDYPEKEVTNGDYIQSFPSGHTSLAFTSATFTTFVLNEYYKDSLLKYLIIGGSYGLATTSAILRISSGNHYLTDVIAGALIGSFSGFIVPWLHKNSNDNLSIFMNPTGVYFSMNL